MDDTRTTDGTWTLPFRELTTAWTRALELSFTAAANANRVALATLPESVETPMEQGSGERAPPPAELRPGATESLAYSKSDWRVERSAERREELAVGDSVEFSRTVSEEDVLRFADASGDTNRLHLDDSYAEGTRFGGRIVHGTLVSGLVSAALAALPGTVIFLSQDLSFLGPARVGDRLTAECRIVERFGDDRYRLAATVRNPEGEAIVEGDVTILVDPLPDSSGA